MAEFEKKRNKKTGKNKAGGGGGGGGGGGRNRGKGVDPSVETNKIKCTTLLKREQSGPSLILCQPLCQFDEIHSPCACSNE